jgi:hypothetical protein
MIGAAVTVSALPSSKVKVTTVGFVGAAAATKLFVMLGVVEEDDDEGEEEEEGEGVGVGVAVGVVLSVGVGVGVALGSVEALGSGVGVVGAALADGSGAGVVGSVVVVGSGAELLTGAGVLVSSATAGPASDSVADTARITVAEAIAIRRRRRVFGDAPGVMFTMFLSLHMPL